VKSAPDKEQGDNFWREICGEEVQHNGEAHWIETQYQKNPSMEASQYVKKTLQMH